jgi:hypothetical protein
MTKQDMGRSLRAVAAAGSAIAIAAAALLVASSESLLRSSFAVALESRSPAPAASLALASAKPAPIAGTEDFWLSAMRGAVPEGKPVDKAVAVGDQIALDIGGVHRTLEVANVSEVEPRITQIDTSAAPSRFLMITAKDVGDTSARPIRFVMETPQAGAPIIGTGRTGRTL